MQVPIEDIRRTQVIVHYTLADGRVVTQTTASERLPVLGEPAVASQLRRQLSALQTHRSLRGLSVRTRKKR